MPTWEKILFGVGGAALGAGAVALGQPEALPEAAALEGEATGAATGGGILSSIGNAVKGALTSKVGTMAEGVGLGDVVGGLANKAINGTTPDATAGGTDTTQEANATTQAEQSNEAEQESVADAQQTENAIKNTETTSQAYLDSLNQNVAGRKLAQSPEGQLGIQGLSQYGIAPTVENGNFATQGNMAEVSKMLSDLDNKEQELHTASGDKGELNTLESEAKQMVRQDPRIPSTDWDSADKIIEERMGHYHKQMGATLALGAEESDRFVQTETNHSTEMEPTLRTPQVALSVARQTSICWNTVLARN